MKNIKKHLGLIKPRCYMTGIKTIIIIAITSSVSSTSLSSQSIANYQKSKSIEEFIKGGVNGNPLSEGVTILGEGDGESDDEIDGDNDGVMDGNDSENGGSKDGEINGGSMGKRRNGELKRWKDMKVWGKRSQSNWNAPKNSKLQLVMIKYTTN